MKILTNDRRCFTNKMIFTIYLQQPQPQTLGEVFKNYPKKDLIFYVM